MPERIVACRFMSAGERTCRDVGERSSAEGRARDNGDNDTRAGRRQQPQGVVKKQDGTTRYPASLSRLMGWYDARAALSMVAVTLMM